MTSIENLNEAICGLSYIQNIFQKNGKTFFIGMVAPDKLTTYMDVYKNFDHDKIHWMEEIKKHRELNVPNLNVALKNEIAQGVRDIYLPTIPIGDPPVTVRWRARSRNTLSGKAF